MPERPLVVEAVSVEAIAEGDAPAESVASGTAAADARPAPTETVPMFSGGR